MYKYTDSPYLVPFDDSFSWKDAPTSPPDDVPGKKELKRQLKETVKELDELQRRLYAQNQHAVLLIFQALDAAGKDSTIRAVMRGINPTIEWRRVDLPEPFAPISVTISPFFM